MSNCMKAEFEYDIFGAASVNSVESPVIQWIADEPNFFR